MYEFNEFKKTKTITLKDSFDQPQPNEKDGKKDSGKLFLIYIHKIGENSNGNFEYEFLFSKKPDVAIGVGWESSSFIYESVSDKKPDSKFVDKSYKLISDIELIGIQEVEGFRMLDAVYGIVALGWEYIEDYSLSEALPDDILVFNFKDSKEELDKKLLSRDLKLC